MTSTVAVLEDKPADSGLIRRWTAATASDLGLLAEERDPATGQALGDFPQAISHVGLVNAALALTETQSRQGAAA